MPRQPDPGAAPEHRLTGLDTLRGLAALSVLAYHVALCCGLTRYGALAPALAQLKAGVAVFFVISGCVLWLPYARALAGAAVLPDARRYARRRARRILPAYWVAVCTVAALPTGTVVGPNAWRYYGLVQIYAPGTVFGGLHTAWSLCIESTFYLAVPLLALGLRRFASRWAGRVSPRAQLALCVLVGTGSLGWRAALAGSPLSPVRHGGFIVMTALPGFADWFALGMALAVATVAWSPPLASGRGGRLARASLWPLAGGLMVGATLAEPGDLFLPLYGPVAHVGVGVAAAALVFAAMQSATLSGSSLGRWLGDISYGIYLWNVIVLEILLGAIPTAPSHALGVAHLAGLLLVTVVGTLACASASWYGLERPLGKPWRRDAVAASGAA